MHLDRTIAVIGVPSSAGARRTGLEGAPEAIRAFGLVDRLRAEGFEVEDLGDQPVVSFRPDPSHPRSQNLPLVVAVARQVGDRVDEALARGLLPLVLGGDCSVTVGITAGLLRHHERLGLIYFDGDLDLNTPVTSPSGAFDGMVLAHLLGRGATELAGIGPRCPLLCEEEVVLFGFDADSGWIDCPEIEAMERSAMHRFPLADVRSKPADAATRAVRALGTEVEALLVHFDVDVTDCAATDVAHPQGLDLDSALEALGVFLATPRCAAIAVTELNVERDPGGVDTRRLVTGLVNALTRAREQAA